MRKIIFIIVINLIFGIGYSFSQETTFGKNKIQYKEFNWYFIQSNHFDIYFTDGGNYIAEYTADVAEKAYHSISKSFRYQIANRITIIVHNSHNDFQQTNVIAEYMEEGIGGVTELFKNRVVVPFEGDYQKFRHVIHHELVHGVINEMFYGGSIQSIISNNITLQLPLWFNEGLAEYEALKWDTNSDMFLRDATIHENLPPINYLGGYFAYRGGQAVWKYIADKYGEEKIGEILTRIKGARSVEQGFKASIGLGIEELNERWQKEMRVIFWPDIAKREEPQDYARRLTNHTKDGSFYNTSPTISPQGDKIAFISNRDDYFDVFLMDAIEEKIEKKLVKGQRTPDFEELHLLTPGMSWSPDGKKIALATKSGAQDAIIIIDVKTGKQEKFEFNLDGIFSVDWSHQGDKLTFVGNTSKQSDIYIYEFDTKALINLTNDIFSDAEPTWAPDGKKIYFSSDRKENITPAVIPSNFKIQNFKTDEKDLYRLEVETGLITRLLELPGSDETSPVAVSDGKQLLFISDKNGINNIYLLNLETEEYKPLTNSLTGVYQISISRDCNKMVFASLWKSGFDLFMMKTPLEKDLKISELEPTEYIKTIIQQDRHVTHEIPKTDTIKIAEDIIVKPAEPDSTELYGKDIKLDLRSYVFTPPSGSGDYFKKADSLVSLSVKNNVDENGNYIVNKYKLNFSPDIIYGNAGFNTYYGVQGSTIAAISDMLGNHQIIFLTNLIGELKNSDFALAYFYLPERVDYGIQGFHSARFLYITDAYGFESLFRFRTYGLSISGSYPFSKFNRVDLGLTWLTTSRENLDYSFYPVQRRQLLLTTLSYVFDNSLWGFIAPANGRRYNFTAYGTPKLGKESLSFVSVLADYRVYFKLWQNYTFASRFAGGGSFGTNPQRFIIGGVDNWINREFSNDRIPIENAEDFIFLTSGIPLRGYIYNAKMGTKYLLMNNEFRFPFFGYLAAGPLPVFLASLTGVFFVDMGTAWTHNNQLQLFARNESGNVYMKDLLAGTGTGLRIYLLGFLVKFDVGWWFNLDAWSKPHYYISLGTDF
ncbi:MAG: peptidase MA family metallohydrolase [Bacteroidota bacterium]|nr:peptidase MA family metallohydrolase [Bacteroidota bacterium]